MTRARTKIPNRLREHRRLMGYSQAIVMRKLKLKSTSMISKWEKGQKMPSARNLLKLSILYKTLANELYYELGVQHKSELFPEETDRLHEALKDEFPSNRSP